MPRRWPALGLGALALVAVVLALLFTSENPRDAAAGQVPAHAAAASAALPVDVAASAPAKAGAPLSALGSAERHAQHELWRTRLERAQAALTAYEQAARYPHESRPIEEHPDQVHPFAPVAEDRALVMPGGAPAQGMHLRTTQERIFLAGDESARITLTLVDDLGKTLPLRVTRAVLHEVALPGQTASTAEFVVPVNDAGQAGDARAGDGIFTALLQPATQGFATYAGLVRLDLELEYGGQPGFIYFDLVYSPEQAAAWLPGVREALVDGSLEFNLKADVRMAGRYVVSGRIDDAHGQPVALALFNAEVAAGVREFRLPVYGKLVLDKQPAFPLRLRDVEAYLLKPDAYPDRVMLPRLPGVVHVSRSYPLASFSDALWSSEERTRYLAEYGRDVSEAQRQFDQTGP